MTGDPIRALHRASRQRGRSMTSAVEPDETSQTMNDWLRSAARRGTERRGPARKKQNLIDRLTKEQP